MEEIIQEALTKGVEMHKAGQLDLAKQLYASVIQSEPRQADANHNLGVIEIDTGNIKEAIPLLKIALEENPENAQYWISSIDALIHLEEFDDARRMLDQAKERGAQGQEFEGGGILSDVMNWFFSPEGAEERARLAAWNNRFGPQGGGAGPAGPTPRRQNPTLKSSRQTGRRRRSRRGAPRRRWGF